MKLGLILLISITGILLSISLPHAYSQLTSDNKYLLQASGFVAGTQTIQNSEIDLQFSTGTGNNGNTPITLENGIVSISGDSYLNSGIWASTLLRNGQFIVVTGDAQNSIGNTIHVNIFGRLVQTSQEGSVYYFTGKITGATEPFQISYSAKITSTVSSVITPTQTPPTQTPTSQNQGNIVQVSIVSGASNQFNQNYFSPSSIQVTPGTTIVWTNNDSVPHQIESGIISTSSTTAKGSFSPDGKFDSGVIAPGKTFQYTVNNVGTITFYDPSYLWMSGAITSKSEITTQVKTTQISILSGASTMKSGQVVSPPSIQITPGTTIIWTNNDSVPHTLLSGVLVTTTQGHAGGSVSGTPVPPSFYPDGEINSGTIQPGQTFQFTITRTGTITLYDPSYSWINSVISSISQTSTQGKPIQVSIQPGSSQPQGSASQQNQLYTNHYYLPTDLQIIPGTTIIWTNNDTVSHRVLSGISTQKLGNPFTPDGKFDSGVIAPGQSFQFTINDVGIIRFYDPSYTWMNGVIVSIPASSSFTIAAPSHNPTLH